MSVHGELVLGGVLVFLGPGDGEGVGSDAGDGREVDVCVLTGLEGPWTLHLNCNSASISWECFDNCSRTTETVATDQTECTEDEAFGDPDGNAAVDERKLGKVGELEMVPDSDDHNYDKSDVEVFEGLVEGVANWGAGLDHDGHESSSGLDVLVVWIAPEERAYTHNHTIYDHRAIFDSLLNCCPASCSNLRCHPCSHMCDSLNGNDTSEPSMQQIEGIEGEIKRLDQKIVSA